MSLFELFAYACLGFGAVSEFISKTETFQMKISAFALLAVAAGLVYGAARTSWKVCAWLFAALVIMTGTVTLVMIFASPETQQALGMDPESGIELTLDALGGICGLISLYVYFFSARKTA